MAGRPTSYKKEFSGMAAKICELGGTDEDIIEALGIARSTYYLWKTKHKEFSDSITVGKNPADERVKMALYRRAVGYQRPSEKIFQFQGQEVRIPYIEDVEPDVNAAKFWLMNRRPDEFKSSPEGVQNNVVHNIMPVPVADNAEQWEQAAKANQDGLLKRDS